MSTPPRILVVEDDDDIRTLVCLLLETEGYRSIPASDGLDALQILQENPVPSLILLDFMMPKMNGEELLRALKSSSRLVSVPVVVMSGNDRVREKTRTLQVESCLVKPVDLDTLLDAVRQFASPVA